MGVSPSLMSSISFLNEQACSGRNITWQYLHHGHLPLLEDTQYNIASFPNRTLYNYSACPDAAAILHLHNCWGGTCHPNRWSHEFKRYEWNNWNGLNDPLVKSEVRETKTTSNSDCQWTDALPIISQGNSGVEMNHDEKNPSYERNDLKKREQKIKVDVDDESFRRKDSEIEKRSHGVNEYPHPLYPGPSLTNPSRPVRPSKTRVLNFGSNRGKPISSDNPSKSNMLLSRDRINKFNQPKMEQQQNYVDEASLAKLAGIEIQMMT